MTPVNSTTTHRSFICKDCGITVFLNKNGSAECPCCGRSYSEEEAEEQIEMERLLRENDLFRLHLLPIDAKIIKPEQFAGNPDLESIVIPGTVKTIGDSAFLGCPNLKKVIILEGVCSIEKSAFKECPRLEEIEIPSSVESLSDYVFLRCRNLKMVNLHRGLKSISDTVFKECTSLKEITIPSSVEFLGDYVFLGCTNLEKVKLHKGLKTIGMNVFNECTSLKRIDIPSSVKSLGSEAFSECSSLEEVVLHEGLETIYSHAFQDCSALETINLPESVDKDDLDFDSVFSGCDNLDVDSLRGSDFDDDSDDFDLDDDSNDDSSDFDFDFGDDSGISKIKKDLFIDEKPSKRMSREEFERMTFSSDESETDGVDAEDSKIKPVTVIKWGIIILFSCTSIVGAIKLGKNNASFSIGFPILLFLFNLFITGVVVRSFISVFSEIPLLGLLFEFIDDKISWMETKDFIIINVFLLMLELTVLAFML